MRLLPFRFGSSWPVRVVFIDYKRFSSNKLRQILPSVARTSSATSSLFLTKTFSGAVSRQDCLDWSCRDYIYGKNSKLDLQNGSVKRNLLPKLLANSVRGSAAETLDA